MADDNKEILRNKILNFLKTQSTYNESQQIKIARTDGDFYFVLYGSALTLGVAGFGRTADSAYDDFIDNWKVFMSQLTESQKRF
jgi:hypothetical protein